MKITEYLKKDNLIAELKATTREEVLQELAHALSIRKEEVDLTEVVRALEDREKLGTTCLGDGVAVPHAKVKGFPRMMVSFGRSLKGVDFDSPDGRPVNLFFLLVAPEGSHGEHLLLLSRLCRILRGEVRDKLLRATSKDEIYRIIEEEDQRLLALEHPQEAIYK